MRILASASIPSVNSFPRKIGSGPAGIHFKLPVVFFPLHRIRKKLIGVGEQSKPLRIAGLLVVGMISGRQNAVHALDGFDLRPGIDLQQIVVVDRRFQAHPVCLSAEWLRSLIGRVT